MTQPFRDWTVIESKDFGTFKYSILDVEDSEGRKFLRGWVFAPRGATWLEADSLQSLRADLLNFGRQNT